VISEFLIPAAIIYGAKYLKKKLPMRARAEKFDKVMQESKLLNASGQMCGLKNMKITDYGYSAILEIPNGMNPSKIEGIKETIETNMKCLVEIERSKFKDYAIIRLIENPLNDLDYKPVPTKSYEAFIGYKYTGQAYKLNMNEDTGLLIGGKRGSGKSRLLYIILTTLLHNHTQKEIEVYLMEIAKRDLRKFRYLPQVRWFADTVVESKLMLQTIEKKIEERTDRIDKAGAENIYEYNQKARIKMKYVWVFADEYSLYMPQNDDNEQDKKDKEAIIAIINRLAKLGRAVGIFFISGLQRSTVTEINPVTKSQLCRCSFSQLSALDSNNLIGIPDAFGLQPQECILLTGSEYVHLKTPKIDIDKIKELLKLNISPVDEKDTSDVGKEGYRANKLNYEETLKLREYYKCNDVVMGKSEIEEALQKEVKREAAITNNINHKKGGVVPLREVVNNDKQNG
jgi:energy-coupling factor transporter ATP-binding protein EcfA2